MIANCTDLLRLRQLNQKQNNNPSEYILNKFYTCRNTKFKGISFLKHQSGIPFFLRISKKNVKICC